MLRVSTRPTLLVIYLFTALLAACAPGGGRYPDKPIQLTVPFPAGGGTDLAARAFADAASKSLGQPLTVVNKVGAGGVTGAQEVAAAKPDGYTLGMIPIGPVVTQPILAETPYTVPDSFEPICQVMDNPVIVVVPSEAPYNTPKEFADFTRSRPETTKYGAVPDSVPQMTIAAFAKASDAKLEMVPFQGNAPVVTALLGGHVQAGPVQLSEVVGPLKEKKLKALAAASAEPMQFEGRPIPTFRQQGLDLVFTTWTGVMAPKGTPVEVLSKLESTCKSTVESAAFKQAMEQQDQQLSYLARQEFRDRWTKDIALYKRITAR